MSSLSLLTKIQLIYPYDVHGLSFCFPCGSAGKESACKAGDLCLISGLGRSPGEGKGYPLQYSGLENSMDSIVHEVAKSRTQLSDFHFEPGHGKAQDEAGSQGTRDQGPRLLLFLTEKLEKT